MFPDLGSKGRLMGPGTTVGGPRGDRAGTTKERQPLLRRHPKWGRWEKHPGTSSSTPLPSLSQGPAFTYTQLEAGEHKRLRH